MKSKPWKPQLLANDPAGIEPDWDARLHTPTDWLYSTKKDGVRIELMADGIVKGRSLKILPSEHIKAMGRDIDLILQLQPSIVLEGEFYAAGMSFPELIHFSKTEDVTSKKTKLKYDKLWKKTGGKVENGWKFPGREVDFLTSWHDDLKFHMFGVVDTVDYTDTFEERYDVLSTLLDIYNQDMKELSKDMVLIEQYGFTHIDAMYQAFDQSLLDGHEGLVLMHKQAQYKPNRFTLNEAKGYKVKDNNIVFDGQILKVVESTIVKEGTAKKVNELGRSKTSQLKEDRLPSGMAKGFLTRMEDGRELTVSLKDYTHPMRKLLWEEREEYVDKWIRFTAMKPTSAHGVPRSSFLLDIRDDK